jgi:hypothetical protein
MRAMSAFLPIDFTAFSLVCSTWFAYLHHSCLRIWGVKAAAFLR